VIAGHSILGDEPIAGADRRAVGTPYGEVEVLDLGSHLLLQRHGLGSYRTARRVEHRGNLAALVELGCDRVLSVGSVGGLKPELGVGTFLCPDDFIALQLGLSYSDGHGGERVPAFEPAWRARVMDAWARRAEVGLLDGGVYWQAIGPRFETPAEIRLMAAHADVVGMTIASECVLAGELDLPYATVCVVDNLANGVGGGQLSVEEFEDGKALNRGRLLASLGPVVAELGGEL
jgi:5'-methylthioadenosine phosphorylase